MLLSHTPASAPRPPATTRKQGDAASTGPRLSHSTTVASPQLTGLGALGLLVTTSAHAHEGHGMASSMHWHATDVLGFVVAAIALVALVWWTRK